MRRYTITLGAPTTSGGKVISASSEDPYSGVLAANRAVQTVLDNLSQFLMEKQK